MMQPCSTPRPPARERARARIGVAALALLSLYLTRAVAETACIATPYPALAPLQVLVTKNARQALAAVEPRIRELRSAPAADQRVLASLYAIESESYGMLELDADARAAAQQGLRLVTREDDPVRVALLSSDAENVYDADGLQAAVTEVESARRAQEPGSVNDACLLGTLGLLQMRMNRPDLAIVSLTDAYRTSDAHGFKYQKVLAAATLASVMGILGDTDQALALNKEMLDWAAAHDDTLNLSVVTFLRGKIYASIGQYAQAQQAFAEARRLSVLVDDPQGVAFADLSQCDARIGLADLTAARALCSSALRAFTASKSTDVAKEAQALLGRIELEEGHAARALAIFNEVLDHQGRDMYARRVMSIYQWRARANAALGKERAAFADLTEYMSRYRETNDAERQRNATGERVKFEMTLKDQELQRVRAEALAARYEASRQALVRNLVALSAVLLVAIALLVTWLWRRRKAAESIRRATEDRLASIGRLTGGIAHEFNNLLTVIQQAGGLLARQSAAASDPKASELANEILRACEVCAEITTQLLSFARQQNLHPERIEIAAFLREILPMLEKLAGPAMRVAIDTGDPALAVQVDRRQLTAALLNLVANARDASGPGATVTVRATTDGDRRVVIDVVDRGSGMNSDVLAHATEPFFSTKPVGAGSGLGLSMVDGFARQSGGSMALSSAPQQGTTVTLRLPRSGADA